MAKWMNKMGLAAINFEIDDSKIAGFNKGFVDSREGSPASTPRILKTPFFSIGKKRRPVIISSAGDSDNDSDKESNASWQQLNSINNQILRLNSSKSNVKTVRLSFLSMFFRFVLFCIVEIARHAAITSFFVVEFDRFFTRNENHCTNDKSNSTEKHSERQQRTSSNSEFSDSTLSQTTNQCLSPIDSSIVWFWFVQWISLSTKFC